jgi:hypothetical protein
MTMRAMIVVFFAMLAMSATAAELVITTPDGDNAIEAGEHGAGWISFLPGGTRDVYSGTFVIEDASITELIGNVNVNPADVRFQDISISGGAAVTDVSPRLPYMPELADSISFRVVGLGVGEWAFSITARDMTRGDGGSAMSGQLSRVEVASVPTSGTLWLLGAGLAGLGGATRRKHWALA